MFVLQIWIFLNIYKTCLKTGFSFIDSDYFSYYSQKGKKIMLTLEFFSYNRFFWVALIWFGLEIYHPQCCTKPNIRGLFVHETTVFIVVMGV